jgi:hypothetical protein
MRASPDNPPPPAWALLFWDAGAKMGGINSPPIRSRNE